MSQLTDRLKESGQKITQKIQESPAYAQATDRYESLSPLGQKLVWVVATFFIVFTLLFYPLSNLSESQLNVSLFEEKRALIRDLFKTYRESSANLGAISTPPQRESLRATIEGVLARAELLPEQNMGLNDISPEGRLIPNNLVGYALELKLAKLNLKQIVEIGSSLVGISESVKMKDLSITANAQDTRYFDVSYKLYSLKVPEPIPEPIQEPEPSRKRSSGSSKGSDE